MALSESQQKINVAEFSAILKNPLYKINKAAQPRAAVIEKIVLEACIEKDIVLNSDFKKGLEKLIVLINAANAARDFDEAVFKKEILNWANRYRDLTDEASRENVQLLANQARGIVRGLRDEHRLIPQVWCEDLDIQQVLQKIIVHPDKVSGSGTYILNPIALNTPDFLIDQLRQVLSNNAAANLKLLIPTTLGGHWRLAKVEIVEGKINSATLWDSMNNDELSTHPAFESMQQALNDVQPDAQVLLTPDAKGIQYNTWSCGDYVMQECLREKKDLASDNLASIRDVKNPAALRQAVVQTIGSNNPDLQAFIPAFVAEQKLTQVSVSEVGLFRHLTDAKHKTIQEQFDETMAKKLKELFDKYPNEQDEAKLVDMARDATYEKFANNLPKLK